jgi:hypothetical protein
VELEQIQRARTNGLQLVALEAMMPWTIVQHKVTFFNDKKVGKNTKI